MSTGITRLHGGTTPSTLTGGYQIRWFEVADTGYDSTPAGVNSKFEKAVRAIETVATVVVLGTVGTGGFMVGVDGGSFYGRGDSTGYAADTSAATLSAAILAATDANTVTEKYIGGGTGLVFTTL
jgi:hypothetical protein